MRVGGRAPEEVGIRRCWGGQEESAGGKSTEKRKTLRAGSVWRSRRGRKVREGATGKKDVRV